MYRDSEDRKREHLVSADIGGTNAATAWLKRDGFDRFVAEVILCATWTDPLTTCKLQQDTDGQGGGIIDLTTSGTGAEYDSADYTQAANTRVTLEARAQDFEKDHHYVRLYVACAANSGVDNIQGVLEAFEADYRHAHLDGPASVTHAYVAAGV